MKLRVSVGGTSLFSTLCFSFAFYGLSTIEAAPSACSRNNPGYDTCREINADCFDFGNTNYTCQCSKGYWMVEGRCQRSDWCAAGEVGDLICKSNGTTCKSLEWTPDSYTKLPFECECESKYAQSGVCSVNALYCQQRGARSVKHEDITLCNCESDQFFDYSTFKCHNLDICPFVECKGKYEECQGSECVCKTSYTREGNVCRPRKYCDSTKCGSAKCEEGPEDDPKSVRCYCDSGYVLMREAGRIYCKLVRCESRSLNPCDQLCLYTADKKSSYCACLPGHSLKQDNISCSEIQASYECSYNVCNSTSVCVKIRGENICMCKDSFVGQRTCRDRCAAGELLPGTCPDRCKSIERGFQCVCEGKYQLSKNQVTCEERRMCLEGGDGFKNCSKSNRTCTEMPETEEGYICGECMYGLQEYEGNCTDLCEVEENERFCEERGGTCASVNELTNEVECKCPFFFAWKKEVGCVFPHHSYTGQLRIFNSYEENPQNGSTDVMLYGEDDLDWKKLDHDISKSMLTLLGQALSGMNVLHCSREKVEETHEESIVCTIELQLHFEDYGILERLTSYTTCRGRNHIPNRYCFIPPYLKLMPTDTTNVEVPFRPANPCRLLYLLSVCPASTNCVSEDIGFSCRCEEGFAAKSTLFFNNDKTGIMEMCEDINECARENPCPNGTVCTNTMGDFQCPCTPGLFRWHVSGNPKQDNCTRACDPVNCVYGKCENLHTGFYCRCDPGYSGLYCDEIIPGYHRRDQNSTSGRTTIIVVGIIEAVIFIAFIIVAVIFRRYWKCSQPKNENRNKHNTLRTGAQVVANRTIDHVHMRRTTAEPNGNFRSSLQEEPDEPIYADCTQIT